MRFSIKLLRGLLWTLWIVYVAAAVGLLGLRYLVLPRIDEWRPQIERYASDAVGAAVRIGHIQADWSGLNPRLTLTGVEIADGQGAPVLTLPAVDAVVAWRSILNREPRLVYLQADGLDLTLRRDRDDHLWVAGQSIDLAGDDSGAGRSVAVRWLARQREIVLRHATVRWVDESRAAPELVLEDASFVMLNGVLSHRFALQARPPAALAARLTLRGEVERSLFNRHPLDPSSWHGQVYAEVADGQPTAWNPWLDMPGLQGRMAARAWLRIDGRRLGAVTMDVVGRDVGWNWQDGVAASAGQVRARLEGLPGDLIHAAGGRPLFARSANGAGLALQGQATDIHTVLPGVFEQPRLALDSARLDTTVRRAQDGTLALDLRDVQFANDDLDARLHGRWEARGDTDAGTADLQGTLRRATMSAIHQYLPLTVSQDAREWLARGLQAGVVRDADIVVQGDLNDFPFSQPGQRGRFHIGGQFTGATVDYAPATATRKAWPALLGLDGSFAIDGAALRLDGKPGAILRPAEDRDSPVRVGAVQAGIPNMEQDAELYLHGATQGPVSAYLSLAQTSPLGALLDNRLAQARGTGEWQVALALRVPLLNTDDTTVEGSLSFNGNDFTMFPQIPPLTQLRGMLEFTESDLRARDVQAQFLGGPLRINGNLLDARNGLRFEGQVSAAALAQWAKIPAMSRFSGRTAVRARLLYLRGGRIDVTAESDLSGMAIDMPAPVGKAASASLPVRVQWSPAQNAGARDRNWLTASLGENINLLLEQDPTEKRWTFARGSLGANQPATLPQQGMSIRLRLPDIDVDAWQAIADSFDPPLPANAKAKRPAATPLLPPPDMISIDTPRMRVAGVTLNDLKLYAVRPASMQWRVDIQSRQAQGAVSWREASGSIAGQVTARFKYLSFGEEGREKPADDTSSGDDLKDIPAVDLQADSLRFYGKDLGSLQILGTNVERGHRWRLDKLRIANNDASLDATGFWQLSGPQRGLTVDASAKWADFGKLLTRLGWPDVAAGGMGSADGKLTWYDLPWSQNVASIDGTLSVKMDKGRLVHLNSRTGRLLELLSMQSLRRLAKLELNPANLFREGFPFDTIRARFNVSKGVIRTDHYKVNGPVAAIVLSGSTSIIDETWDLKAVVIPNLDASGAAVATALAVNPLLGLGAFLTQWVLKNPLARAMTVQYAVTGPWSDPKIAPIEAPLPAEPEASMPRDPIEN